MASDVWQHDYTWSGHPVCAAVALRAPDLIDSESLITKCAERGRVFLDILKNKLEGLHVVQQVRGTGVASMGSISICARAMHVIHMMQNKPNTMYDHLTTLL